MQSLSTPQFEGSNPSQTESRERWPWLSVAPLGLGAWAPIYAGVRARKALWWALGLLWSLITIAGWVLATTRHRDSGLAGGLIIIGWIGAIATSFSIRNEYARLTSSSFQSALLGAERSLAEREQARRLAIERPALALELGVGRPDLPNAQDAGLIDINNAPAATLAELPGVDDALATRIAEVRAETQGFSSVEDLGATLDLDPRLVEALRERVVFLPR